MKRTDIDIEKYILKQICFGNFNVSAGDMLLWAEDNSDRVFGIDLLEYRRGTRKRKRCTATDDVSQSDTNKPNRTLNTLRELIAQQDIPDIFACGFDTGVDAIIDTFNLSHTAARFFALVAYYEKYNSVNCILSDLLGRGFSGSLSVKYAAALALICGVDKLDLLRVLDDNGELFQTGLLKVDTDGDIMLYGCIRKMVLMSEQNTIQIKNNLMGPALHSELTLSNFAHVSNDYKYISVLLQRALAQHTKGINILLYGVPGTGKTEFAKSICDNIKAKLYNLDQDINSRDSRMSALARGHRLTSMDSNTVLLMDEAEDVFSSYERRASKLLLNKLLESNITPVIWITNNIDDMDNAFIRRFQYVTEIKKPDDTDRREIWQNICDKYNVCVPTDKISEYVRNYDVAPSVIDKVVAGAALTGQTACIDRVLENMQIALTGCVPVKRAANNKFVPELLNTDTDLTNLTNCLVKGGTLGFSLCLYGASGTGKSAYAVYLAERMGLKYIHKRVSDLSSKYVGDTEKNIALAFREATEKKAILIFDEADSFLQNREGAQRSWEVTAVNEMLTQMEMHQYPFICTTNLMDKLDAASLRRFSFKIKYDFMTPAQVQLAFKQFFDKSLDSVPSNLYKLAPGDFVVVKNKCKILGITDTDEILKLLDAEQKIKDVKYNHNKIGF